VQALLIFHQPFGFNAILGLIGLSGILMRNTLILIGQIHSNQADGLDPYHAIIEATVQRSRPVILTALAAVLAFIPLTHSVFWGSMAYVLIGGTAVGTVLTLAFLPALYAIWFRVSDVGAVRRNHGQQVPQSNQRRVPKISINSESACSRKSFGVRGQCPSMSQSRNLNPFSKLLSHFSLFDSQFFAAPFAIHDCCLSCRRVALSDIFGLWQSTGVSISSRNIICALSQPMAAALR